jgi:hypothetical protein
MNKEIEDLYLKQKQERMNFCEFETLPPVDLEEAIKFLVRKFENIDISQLANLLKPWYKTWETKDMVAHMLFWKRLSEDFRGQTLMLPKE